MEADDFKRWRKSLGLSQKDAAHALGLKRRVVQYYEKGERDGKALEIPRYIRLACAALTAGFKDFNGPPKGVGEKDAPKKVRKGAKKAAKAGKEDDKAGAGEVLRVADDPEPETDVEPETPADADTR
jgi:transcriptional regulator with XRE-family HTH domain